MEQGALRRPARSDHIKMHKNNGATSLFLVPGTQLSGGCPSRYIRPLRSPLLNQNFFIKVYGGRDSLARRGHTRSAPTS